MRGSLRTKSIISALKTFVSDNKKVIICASIIFVLGIIVGVISAFRSVGEDGFERVARADMEFGAVKVFFISLLALLVCYAVFLIAGINDKTVFLIVCACFPVLCQKLQTAAQRDFACGERKIALGWDKTIFQITLGRSKPLPYRQIDGFHAFGVSVDAGGWPYFCRGG